MLDTIHQNDSVENRKYHDKIWREQINLVAENAVVSNVFSWLLALVIAVMLWSHHSHDLIIGWLSIMSLIAGVRIVISVVEHRSRGNDQLHKPVAILFLGGILITAFGWGVAAYTLFPSQPAELQ